MNKTAIFYGSSSGNTESIAKKLSGLLNADVYDVAQSPTDKLADYNTLIFGASTWGLGDLQDDWEDFLPKLAAANLQGKNIALFGLGDADGYPDTFVDGIGTIYKVVQDKGCKIVGFTSTEGYSFDDSTALIYGQFVGLPLDEDNESKLTDSRLQKWVEQIKGEIS